MTYRENLLRGGRLLKEHGIADAETDAWLLLAWLCRIDRNFYYMHMQEDMPDRQQEEYALLLGRRTKRIPLQYITGEQEFMGLRFLVNSDVLIPRQDTEILAEEAIKRLRPGMELLDLCTGSGCILISILKHVPQICATASDISGRALLMAEKNARLNGVCARFVESDLFDKIMGRYDMILSNPPYIPTGEIKTLMPEVKEHEPVIALDGSADGLLFYKRIIAEGKKFLKPGGILLFEIGCRQGEDVSFLLSEAGYTEILVIKDLAGLDRVVMGLL